MNAIEHQFLEFLIVCAESGHSFTGGGDCELCEMVLYFARRMSRSRQIEIAQAHRHRIERALQCSK